MTKNTDSVTTDMCLLLYFSWTAISPFPNGIFPHTTSCTVNVHAVLSLGMSVQVAVVMVVVLGHVPQFSARILYCTAEHSEVL